MATTATAITIKIPAIIRMTVEKNTKFIQSLCSSDFLSNLQELRKKKRIHAINSDSRSARLLLQC